MSDYWLKWTVVKREGEELEHGFGPMKEELNDAFDVYRKAVKEDKDAELHVTIYKFDLCDNFVIKTSNFKV